MLSVQQGAELSAKAEALEKLLHIADAAQGTLSKQQQQKLQAAIDKATAELMNE